MHNSVDKLARFLHLVSRAHKKRMHLVSFQFLSKSFTNSQYCDQNLPELVPQQIWNLLGVYSENRLAWSECFSGEYLEMVSISTFNVDDGFAEGLLRGYRIGFLTDTVSLHNHLIRNEV